MRAHCLFCSLSCLRPDAVSRYAFTRRPSSDSPPTRSGSTNVCDGLRFKRKYTMERWKERSWLHGKRAVRRLLDPLRDAEAMPRLELERPEDHQIQRSLQQFSPSRHSTPLSETDIDIRYDRFESTADRSAPTMPLSPPPCLLGCSAGFHGAPSSQPIPAAIDVHPAAFRRGAAPDACGVRGRDEPGS